MLRLGRDEAPCEAWAKNTPYLEPSPLRPLLKILLVIIPFGYIIIKNQKGIPKETTVVAP